jgi:hypothetical protein
MKGLAIAIALGCSTLAACAQSQQMQLRTQGLPDPAIIGPQPTNRLQRIFGPTATYEGVLPDLKRRGNLVTRRDLDAPVIPGREFRNVSVNPHTGRPEGITLLAIRF